MKIEVPEHRVFCDKTRPLTGKELNGEMKKKINNFQNLRKNNES